ncbi:protein hir1 [Blastomyces percursus]|uniref:Protein HIR n=1 Tax=Blastomyces percursus TaxID=1658174 RepID=A0A1J9Q659_9EURO|nr:protein hir1 [Blastomyces percursus]
MHIIKPVWLTHGGERKDFEVYSCDVSPDGERLVTAAGDGHVRIWSTEAIYNTADPAYANKPRQLASMSNHSGTIHAVRFSPNGRYVASGADDKIVCIYVLESNPPSHASSFGTNEPPPVENWRTIRRLIGHDNDVQDLGWSYDSSILVSVGLDSKVVVWSGHTFEKLKTISNHQSHVKGITFDPANKYFATAGDDRTVRIFRFTPPTPNSTAHDQMNNFVLEQTISAPFVNSPLTTYFRRCSWSPDGNHIAAANAVNGPVSSVAIVNRGSWDGDINLIGHEGPVEVCAFSPRLYDSQPASKPSVDKQGHPMHTLVTVIACAGADKSLSIWITSNPRPIVVTQDLAAKAISDLSWSPDGKCLFVTALDGTILCVRFENNELGKPMPLEENEKSLTKFGTNRRGAGIIESTNGLLLEEKSKADEIKGVEGRMGALMGDGHASTDQGTNEASVNLPSNATTPAGASTPIGGGANVAQKGHPNGPVNGTSGEQDKPDPYAAKLERLKQRPTYTKDGKKRIQPLLVSGAGGAESSLPQSRLVAAAMNTGVRPDGPDSILDLSKPFDGLPKGGLAALLFGNKRKFAQIEGGDEEVSVEKRVALASENGAVPILANATEGLRPAQPRDAQGGPRPTPEFIRPAVVNPCMAISQLRLAVPKIRSHILQAIDSSGNPTSPADTMTATGAGPSSGPPPRSKADIIFEARNPPASSGRHIDREPVRITLTRGDQPLWQDFIPKTVLLVTGNRKLWSAASEDGSVYVWTPAGRRLLNALVLEAQPVILECNGPWVLCINAVGMCYVWNVTTLSSPHPPISLAPILDAAVHTLGPNATPAPAINAARLNSEGRIVVTLSNGDGYSYSPALYTWQRMSEGWWAVGSQYWNTKESSVGNLQSVSASSLSAAAAIAPSSRQDGETRTTPVSAGVIPFLERNTTDEALVRGRGFFLQRLIKALLSREGFEGFEAGVSVAHLENRVAAALALGAKEEFRLYLSMYAKRLGAEGAKMKAEELLEGLLGGIFEDGGDEVDEDSSYTNGVTRRAEGGAVKSKELSSAHKEESGLGTWGNGSDKLCGWPRRTLLNEVVLALGKHRDLQRVTVPYAQLLGILDGDQDQEGDPVQDQHQNMDRSGEDVMVT